MTNKKILVSDLTTEGDSTSQKFLIIGQTPGETSTVVIMIDFEDLHERKCNLFFKKKKFFIL